MSSFSDKLPHPPVSVKSHPPFFNPLRPNISIHLLHTVLYTFPMALTGRIKKKLRRISRLRSFPQFS